MPRTQHPLSLSLTKLSNELGHRIELARSRRDLSASLFAERVGISRNTLARLEAGDPAVSLGTYLKALRVLGMEGDINQVASDDVLGRKLQDSASLRARGRSNKCASA
ncbi:helix-turn-helix domain-containing protein [Diaphorobacter sp. HDW4B]|uniref:helix-turn-helix domain-containing protein n=1 Tax=Diaphorobacter sp. HDW4B TaxID=2714925 RepID=UPI00140AAE63|nr:helix-turn-helix transcriptional regulator [Diaphorobacter sp. HDW4B]QIL73107.1 helix-turn-helix domain-containing protein [Diaphorobacter sp. HDW4B]